MPSSKPPSDAAMERFFRHAILKKGAVEVVLVSLSDGIELDVFTWDLPQDIGEFDLRGTLDDVYAYAQNDVEGYGDLKSFLLVATDDEKERVARSPTFTFEPEDVEEEADDRGRDVEDDRDRDRDSGGGGGGGGLARSIGRGPMLSEAAQIVSILERTNVQLMRHLEAQHRLNTSGSQVTQNALEKIVARLAASNDAMMSTHVESLQAIQAMYDRKQERDLSVVREKKHEERKDQIMTSVMQLLPILQMKLLPGFVPPGATDPRIALMGEFFASVDIEKLVPKLAEVLSAEQMAALMMLLNTFAEQAAAEEARAATKNGAAQAEPSAAENEAPTPNGRH